MKRTVCLCASVLLLGVSMALAEPIDSTANQPSWVSSPPILMGVSMALAEPIDSTANQPPWALPPPSATTRAVYLVRHAEKNTEMLGHDVPLNARGLERSQSLAHTLSKSGLTRVFVTPYRRNIDSAAPLMAALADSARVVDAIAATVDSIQAQPWGSAVLVIGHSNTIPQILASLTSEPAWKDLALAYDDLFVFTQFRSGGHRVLRLGYGGPWIP